MIDSTTTTKTTTIKSNSSSRGGNLHGGDSNYSSFSSTLPSDISFKSVRPIANSKTVVINRTTANPAFASGSVQRIVTSTIESGRSSSLGFTPTASTLNLHADVGNVKSERAKEKQELRELNERFASYIEKVRFLEAQNKKLASELESLRDKWGKETEKVKEMYQVEMDQLRRLLNDSDKRKAELEVQLNSLEDRMQEMQMQLDEANAARERDKITIGRLNQELADIDGEISLLRRRMAGFEDERKRDKAEILRLRDEIKRLRMDLDQETLNHINSENEAQSLRDELEFIKQVHATELKELAALAYRDTTQENRDYWKNEMGQALREIQRDYDEKIDMMRSDLDNHYNIKIQEIRTITNRENIELGNLRDENSRIKTQITEMRSRIPDLEARNAQLERLIEELRRDGSEREREFQHERTTIHTSLNESRSELENVLKEMQNLLDTKLSLELEIAAYRKLLESEESRLGIRGTMESILMRERTLAGGGGAAGGGGISSYSTTNNYSSGGGGAGSGGSGARIVKNFDQDITRTETTRVSSMKSGGGTVGSGGGGVMFGDASSVGILKGEMSAKTTYQRTSKGNISIQDCSPDGKFISIENTGKKREDVGGMRITRNTDNGRLIVRYTIPDRTFLDVDGRDRTLKIWARGQRPMDAGLNEYEMSDSTWGIGSNIVTGLYNTEGEEKATHTQKTIYNT